MTNAHAPSAIPKPFDPLLIAGTIGAPYDNRRLAMINDHEIRMSVMTEAFPWHRHPDSDETFAVLDGELVIEFEEGPVILRAGQWLTVPRGVRHRTHPNGARSVNLTFERAGAATIFDA